MNIHIHISSDEITERDYIEDLYETGIRSFHVVDEQPMINVSVIASSGNDHTYHSPTPPPSPVKEKRYGRSEEVHREYISIIEYSKSLRYLQKRNLFTPIGVKTTAGNYMATVVVNILSGKSFDKNDAVEVCEYLEKEGQIDLLNMIAELV